MKKRLLFVLSVIIVVMLALLLGNNKETGREFLVSGSSFIEGVKIVHRKDGNNVWTLHAKRADIIEDRDQAKLTGIAINVEEKGMTIRAGNGLYDMSSRNLTLNGKITADAKDYTIIADSAELDNSTGEIKTKGEVRVESKKFNVEGLGMEANSGEKVRILKDVKATFYR